MTNKKKFSDLKNGDKIYIVTDKVKYEVVVNNIQHEGRMLYFAFESADKNVGTYVYGIWSLRNSNRHKSELINSELKVFFRFVGLLERTDDINVFVSEEDADDYIKRLKTRNLVKTRLYSHLRKTIYYYDDGSKEVNYWESINEFCNSIGI